MGKESLYSKDSRLVFRETFKSFEDIANKKGVVSTAGSTVLLSGGIVTFPSGGGNIYYDRTLAELPSGNEAWTVRIKAKPTTQGVAYPKLVSIAIGGKQYGIIYEVSTGKIATLHNNGSSDGARFTSGGHFVVGQWIEITVTHTLNDNTPLIYVNGSLVSMAASLGGANPIVYNNRLRLANGIDTVSNYPFRGDMEFVEVYNATLTATEVSELYKKTLYTEPNLIGNTVLDINPNLGNFNDKYNHTVTNTSVSLVKSVNSLVGSYNGSTSILTLTDTDDLSFGDGAGNDRGFSIEAWVRITRSSQTQVIVAKGVNYEYSLYKSVGNLIRLNLWSNNPAIYIGRHGSFNDDTTNWKHIVGTYNGNKSSSGIKVYMNGVQIDTANDNNGVYVGMPNSTTNPIIGSALTKGFIGRTRIFNKELSQSEITRLYNSQKNLYI